jgi:hypothetical protein
MATIRILGSIDRAAAITGSVTALELSGNLSARRSTLPLRPSPELTPYCGGLTGVTPLLLYRDWIVDTARKINSPIEP